MKALSGIGLEHMIGPKDAFIEKATEQLELARGEFSDRIDIGENKLGAITELQLLLKEIRAKASALTDPKESGFNNKTYAVDTQEDGSGSDYIKNVSISNNAPSGNIKVAVEQVATTAKLILGSDGEGAGFAKTGAIGVNGTLELTVGDDMDIDIDLDPGLTAKQVRDAINAEFQNENVEFEAVLLPSDDDTVFIEIRAKNEGETDLYQRFNLFNPNNTIVTERSEDGEDAIIYVDGIEHTQSSNKFKDIAGISFELAGRVNDDNDDLFNHDYGALNYNTIRVTEDHKKVAEMITDFGNSLSALSHFVAVHDQSSRSISADKYADPFALRESYNDAEATLRGSSLIGEARAILERFTTLKSGAEGDISSIYDLGMSLKPVTKDGVTYDAFHFADYEKFEAQFLNNFDAVKKFFITGAKITSNPGNDSKLYFIPRKNAPIITSSQVVGKDIQVTATYDNDGVVTGFIAQVGGQNIAATNINHLNSGNYNVSFEGKILEGIMFSIDPGTAANTNENFTFNYTAGMANIVENATEAMYSSSGLRGSAVNVGNNIKSENEKLTKDLEKVEKDLNAKTNELTKEYATIMQMNMMVALQVYIVEQAMGAPAA